MNHTELNVLSKEETTIKQMEAERKLGKRHRKKNLTVGLTMKY
jgi:hypothetical protein